MVHSVVTYHNTDLQMQYFLFAKVACARLCSNKILAYMKGCLNFTILRVEKIRFQTNITHRNTVRNSLIFTCENCYVCRSNQFLTPLVGTTQSTGDRCEWYLVMDVLSQRREDKWVSSNIFCNDFRQVSQRVLGDTFCVWWSVKSCSIDTDQTYSLSR